MGLAKLALFLLVNVRLCRDIIAIAYGRFAFPGERPYQVAIIGTYTNVNNQRVDRSCSGTLIRVDWILTAAHCFYITDAQIIMEMRMCDTFTISAGNLIYVQGQPRLSQSITFTEADYLPLRMIHPHHLFRWATMIQQGYDIGLIRLPNQQRFRFNMGPGTNINFIPWINFRWDKAWILTLAAAGIPAQISGWGDTERNSVSYPFLKVGLTRLENIDYNGQMVDNRPVDERLFIVNKSHGAWTCHGDSGSPLILNNLLIGVYSFEYPMGLTLQCNLHYGSSDYRRKLFFSTNVYEYRDWINYVVNYNYPANRKLI